MISSVIALIIILVLVFSLYNLGLLRTTLTIETTNALVTEAEDMLVLTAESQAEFIEKYIDRYVNQLVYSKTVFENQMALKTYDFMPEMM
jgi:hypothetical protein